MAALLQCLSLLLVLAAASGQETTTVLTPQQDSKNSTGLLQESSRASDVVEPQVPKNINTTQVATKPVKGHSGSGKPDVNVEPDAIKIDLGGKCSSDKDCWSVENTSCKEKICKCNQGYVPSKLKSNHCVKVPSGLGDSCEQEAQCEHAVLNSDCRDGQCQCPPNYFLKNTTCWEKKPLSDTCEITEQCETVTSAVCSQGVCHCPSPLIPSPTNTKCLESASKQYGNVCEEDIQCSASYGDQALCRHGTCHCTSGYHYNGTTCIIDKNLGDACTNSAECLISEENGADDSRICSGNVCICASGYYSFTGQNICSKTSSGDELAVSFTLVVCIAVARFYFE